MAALRLYSPAPDPPGPRRRAVVLLCLTVLALEGWIFLYQSKDWDLAIYHRYATTCRETSLAGMYARHTVEYPPAAVLLIVATDAVAQQLPDCSALGGTFPEFCRPASFANFKFLFRLEMAGVAFTTFVLLLTLLRGTPTLELAERLLTFAVALALLSHSAFDRLDVLLGALVLVSAVLLSRARRPLLSFAVLALAIAYKVVPVAVAPLWVLASLPTGLLTRQRLWSWRLLLAGGGRSLLLAGLTAAFVAPVYLAVGPRCLAFLSYHRERGIEYASTYAAVLGVFKHAAGLPTVTRSCFGSWDVESSWSPALSATAPLLAVGLLAGVALLMFRSLRSGREADLTGHVVLALMALMAANKVFSPQYVLWLVPLVPLVKLPAWPRRLFLAGFLALCLVTAWLNPRWMTEAVGPPLPSQPGLFAGPTLFGTVLLAARSVLLVGLSTGLAASLVARGSRLAQPVPQPMATRAAA